MSEATTPGPKHHVDTGISDSLELLCETRELKVSRYRMVTNLRVPPILEDGSEVLIVSMKGRVLVQAGGDIRRKFLVGHRDLCYLPRGVRFALRRVTPSAEVIIASAPAERTYPPFLRRFSAVRPILSGAEGYQRRIFTMVGEGDRCERFLGGLVEGSPGNWTSFPPHRHDGKPEVYVYYGLGKLKYGLQAVIDSGDSSPSSKVFVVRDGDAVLFERGYHPNVAPPGVTMCFLWIISANPSQRDLTVSYDPAFRDTAIGQTHLRGA